MDVRKVMLFAAILGMTAHVCADEPTPAQPAPPASASTASSAPTEAKQEPAPKSAAIEGQLDQDKIMAAQKAGYEIRNENGETLLCRKEPKTGSRLRHTVSCMTPKQWEQLQSDTQQMLRINERRRLPPKSN
jgi:hypothetical protein